MFMLIEDIFSVLEWLPSMWKALGLVKRCSVVSLPGDMNP